MCRSLLPAFVALAVLAPLSLRADDEHPATLHVRDRILLVRTEDGAERRIEDAREWEERRREIVHSMELAMGALPDRSDLPDLGVRVLERAEGDVYVRERISFVSEPGHRVTAYLWVPRAAPPARGFPAALALHPTSPLGKGVVAGESEMPNRAYGLELARRGWVVIAPDYVSFGENPWDFASDRYVSGSMKGIFDHMRAVDLLVARKDVDASRIAAFGHSLGGHNAIFLGVFDRRVQAIVSSCGWCPFHDYYGGDIRGWTSDRYMPRLRDRYGLEPNRVPFDFYEVVAALAPRFFFTSSPLHDENFSVEGVKKTIPVVREVWELLGAADRLHARYPDAGHDFPNDVRLESYELVEKLFEHTPAETREARVPRPPSGQAWVGLAAVDITPPIGYRMSGYFSERFATGTHDPLRARALWIGDGDGEVAIVLCDLIGLPAAITRRVREDASRRTGIAFERIIVAATHSHTGPLFHGPLHDLFHRRAVAKHGSDPHEPIDYPAELIRRIVDAIDRARARARPRALACGLGEAHGLSFHRRFEMRDGTVRFNPGKLNPDIVRPVGPIDPQVGVLAIFDAEKASPVASLACFALHLDTVGGTEYSADYPLWIERALRGSYGDSFQSLFATGPCGNINHIDVTHDRRQSGQEEARRIGRALAEIVRETIGSARPLVPRIGCATRKVRVPLQTYSAEEKAAAREKLERLGELPFLESVEAAKIRSLELMASDTIELEVTAMRLSNDVALVALPGEVFVELGLAIRERSPFETTIVLELANDAPAYIPTRRGFEEGGYEAINSRVAPGGGEAMVEAAVEALRALR